MLGAIGFELSFMAALPSAGYVVYRFIGISRPCSHSMQCQGAPIDCSAMSHRDPKRTVVF